MKYLKVALLLFALAYECQCWPSGAPQGACISMTPSHGSNVPQNGISPYEVIATKGNNGDVKVTIRGISRKDVFKGFMIQGIGPNQKITGSFQETADIKTINCNDPTALNNSQDTATHRDAGNKSEVVLTWRGQGPVMFRATVVQKYDTFFTSITSNRVN